MSDSMTQPCPSCGIYATHIYPRIADLQSQLEAVRGLAIECQAMVHERLDLWDNPIVEDLQWMVDKLKAAIGENSDE